MAIEILKRCGKYVFIIDGERTETFYCQKVKKFGYPDSDMALRAAFGEANPHDKSEGGTTADYIWQCRHCGGWHLGGA